MGGHEGGDRSGRHAVSVLLDTAVLMFAAGREHPRREPSRAVLPDCGYAEAALQLFGPVLSIDHRVMRHTTDLAGRHATSRARDLVHVATCLTYELEAIISPDEDFDRIGELRRIAVETAGG